MAVNLSPIWGAGAQLLDNSGNVLSGGKIYTYAAGTTTLTVTYTSNSGATANSNPIVLNSAGRVPYEIWLLDGQNYKFVLKDSNDVLIGTWDNLSGINSNFIAYTNEQEIQTATAGQTVFNLTTMQYLPGTNSLSVFVDGVNQYGPGAQYAFTETDSTTVTFASGLHVGAEVKFTSSQLQNAGVVDASQVSYKYDSSDAVSTNVAAKLNEFVSVKDYGAVGDWNPGTETGTDDTAAIQACLDENKYVIFPPGNYAVSTITFNDDAVIYFEGSSIIAYADTPTDCAVRIKLSGGSVYNLKVNLNWNTNYTCAVWWYDDASASQFNNIFGMFIKYGDRGLVYGALPGNANTAHAQSENQLFGFRTRGLQRPFYNNHNLGHLFMSAPIFASSAEEWAAAGKVYNWTVAIAYQNIVGHVYVQGGEIQKAGSELGYAAELVQTILTNVKIETACPVRLTGSEVWLQNCLCLNTQDNISWAVAYSGMSGARIYFDGCKFWRNAGVGAYSDLAMIDVSAAPATNEIYLNNCDVEEWRWAANSDDSILIKGGKPFYQNTRQQNTAASTSYFHINNLRENLISQKQVNYLGTTTNGWYVNGTGTLTVSGTAPTGYSTSLQLVSTGSATVLTTDETSTTTVKNTAFTVKAGDLFAVAVQFQNVTPSTNDQFIAVFYDYTGTALSVEALASGTFYTDTSWHSVFVPLTVPASAVFMGIGAKVNNSTVRFADVKLLKASV